MARLPAITWQFPLARTHCGMLLGNGTFGAMVWGEGGTLRVTLGRADLWDHRGGLEMDGSITYRGIRDLLARGDEKGLRALFYKAPAGGQPQRPSILPIGRLDFELDSGWTLSHGELDVARGEARVTVRHAARTRVLALRLLMQEPVLVVESDDALPISTVTPVPAWEYVGEYLASISFVPPRLLSQGGMKGWVQERPADPALCVGWKRSGKTIAATAVCAEPDAAAASLDGVLGDMAAATRRHRGWWSTYWKRVPEVHLPSEVLSFIYTYGMYKLAGLTNPTGPAATLQGPWIEDYQMPPWSSDYHFNINVQECYWPVFAAGLVEHTQPLFDMLRSWMPKLRSNAKLFLGIDDGLMLPHAVDDRATCMGGFWTGSIDHGSTAWAAELMWLAWRHTGDLELLRSTTYPFLRGALRCYEEMLEWDGDTPSLPVGVSPEYNGDGMNAWGRNPSFQLANIHFLLRALREVCEVLGEGYPDRWSRLAERLPVFTVVGEAGTEEIALWEGLPLERSHRHHSHLAGIYPFDVIDPAAEGTAAVVTRSIRTWVAKGMGEWSGWCMPWASILQSRLGNGEAAELLLEIWERVFTNEGHGTLHNVAFPGLSVMGAGPVIVGGKNKEIMQIEAGMAAVTAVQEMLLQNVMGTVRVMAGVPKRWSDVAYRGMHAEGGFVVDARREQGRTVEVRVLAERGGRLRLANPFAPVDAAVRRGGLRAAATLSGALIELDTEVGEVLRFSPGRRASRFRHRSAFRL